MDKIKKVRGREIQMKTTSKFISWCNSFKERTTITSVYWKTGNPEHNIIIPNFKISFENA